MAGYGLLVALLNKCAHQHPVLKKERARLIEPELTIRKHYTNGDYIYYLLLLDYIFYIYIYCINA